MVSVSCVRWTPKLAGSVETAKSPWKMKGSFQRRRKSGKRDQDFLVLAGELKAQGNVDENARAIINRGLKRTRRLDREEEEFLRELLLEVLSGQEETARRRNVE